MYVIPLSNVMITCFLDYDKNLAVHSVTHIHLFLARIEIMKLFVNQIVRRLFTTNLKILCVLEIESYCLWTNSKWCFYQSSDHNSVTYVQQIGYNFSVLHAHMSVCSRGFVLQNVLNKLCYLESRNTQLLYLRWFI